MSGKIKVMAAGERFLISEPQFVGNFPILPVPLSVQSDQPRVNTGYAVKRTLKAEIVKLEDETARAKGLAYVPSQPDYLMPGDGYTLVLYDKLPRPNSMAMGWVTPEEAEVAWAAEITKMKEYDWWEDKWDWTLVKLKVEENTVKELGKPPGWFCQCFSGVEVYPRPKLPFPAKEDVVGWEEYLSYLEPIIKEHELEVGMELVFQSLFGGLVTATVVECNGRFHAENESSIYSLAWDTDSRHCWVSTCGYNKKVLRMMTERLAVVETEEL